VASKILGGVFGSILWLLFPPSSRERSIRLSVIVLIVLAVSVATLAFREINLQLPGITLERGGTGPLGLKLGLDLRGGGHLVYQADSGTKIDVAFNEAVTPSEIIDAADGVDISASVLSKGGNAFQIRTELLDSDARTKLETALEEDIGSLETFTVTDIAPPTPDQMEGVHEIINRRVNLFGTEEPIIQRLGEDRIIVQLPGASGSITRVTFSESVDAAALRTAILPLDLGTISIDQEDDRTFRLKTNTIGTVKQERLRERLEQELSVAIESFGVTSGIDEAKKLIGQTATLEFKERTCTDQNCISFDDADIGLTGDDLESAYAATSEIEPGWVINIAFNDRGSEIFGELTRRIVGVRTKRIAVLLDEDVLLAPVARAWIRDGRSQISGGTFDPFTREEARTLAIQLESGRLPVPLNIIQESDVQALLGSESLKQSLFAGLVGLGLVMVFMVAYYRMAGIVATVSLVVYALLVLAVFKLIPVTLTLSHIGGFILSVGMAVDANVLIFERMKEEVRIGRTLASAMEVGFNRAWPAIRDGNVSTLITCGVLIWFGDRLGGGLITGFAISLGIGVIASMFTAVVVSRNLLQLLAWIGFSRRINLFTPERVQRSSGATVRRV
jgi:preprotein translocase subunit SecD